MSLKVAENGIFTITKLKSVFNQSVRSSQLLLSLWASNPDSQINNVSTLPLPIKLKSDLNKEIAESSGKQGFSLKTAQTFGYAKELVKFYKHGVKLVYGNYKLMRKLRNSHYKVTNQVSASGTTVNTKVPSFPVLTKEMSQALYMAFVENRTRIENTADNVVKHDSGSAALEVYRPKMFNMPRSDFLLFKRTPLDIAKIPTFSVIFIICMEFTPLLCYFFPEITPLTCILPSLRSRLWPKKCSEAVSNSVPENADLEEIANKTAYNLSLEQVRALADALRLKTKYIPTKLFPELVLRDRLQAHYNFLKVDNYYLSGLNGNGNVWNLDKEELLLACLERNLVSDISVISKLEDSTDPDKEEKIKQEIDYLRLQLAQFIVNFEKFNVGYLLLSQRVQKPEMEALEWRN